jgi:menaquinone-dependent protoporphyrinogen oxidase
MKRILLICSSTDGHTRKICERLRVLLDAGDCAVTLLDIADAAEVSPGAFDTTVIGARVRYGKADPRVFAYIERHGAALQARPSAYFSVNLVARKATKNRAETNPYVQKFLRQIAWRPQLVDVFAGKLEYRCYGPLDRAMIRVIMWMTHGPTNPDAVVEFTDWARVEEFATHVRALGAVAVD